MVLSMFSLVALNNVKGERNAAERRACVLPDCQHADKGIVSRIQRSRAKRVDDTGEGRAELSKTHEM
jgi:hypothetical protein